MRSFLRILAALGALVPALLVTQSAVAEPPETAPIHAIGTTHGRTEGLPDAATKSARPSANGIAYHGGPVMTSATTNAYVIWYGTWSDDAARAIVTDFFHGVGGSKYFNINTSYTDLAGSRVKNSVTFAGEVFDSGSQGTTSLSDPAIGSIVAGAITSGGLPADPTGVYFVLTSKNITKSGFLTNYCGWHTYSTISGTNIKYSFVGDPTGSSIQNCAVQTTISPNGNPGVDAMVSVIAHELEEAVTDPNLNAWYDVRGYENADKCAWTFGTTYTVSNGSLANMKLGTRDYLIQRNWLNANGGLCTLSYP